MHRAVLLKEVLEYLDPHPGDFMIDGTIDGGNHAAAIMEKLTPGGKLLGVDWDAMMVERWRARIAHGEVPGGGTSDSGAAASMIVVHGNYADLPEILLERNLPKADGLLLDLGFSSEQLIPSDGSAGRGFSFASSAANEPLFMTYDDSQESVSEILRRIDEKLLADVIYEFGGERGSRRIAKAIKDRGRRKPILTAGDLAETVRSALPRGYEHGRIDPATRTFQALRIYANGELKNIKKLLDFLGDVVKSGGRVAIITFHSLEDRIVKQAFQKLARERKLEILTKKPIAASQDEIRENPRARSAKLRVATLT